jgi:hypothetical protein
LIGNQCRDRVGILLAIDGVAVEGVEKRPAAQVLPEPFGARERAGDGRCERRRFGGDEHRLAPRDVKAVTVICLDGQCVVV